MERVRIAAAAVCGCALMLLSACGDGDESEPSADSLGPDVLQVVYNDPGSSTPFTGLSSSSTSLQLSLAGVSEPHSVAINAASTDAPTTNVDLTTVQGTPTITPDTAPQSGGFVISHTTRDDETFDTFPDFAAALTIDMVTSATVITVAATGSYDSSSTTFTAKTIAVQMND